MECRKFKDFVLEEGELFDAIKYGFKTGIKAFSQKREQQAKDKRCKTVAERILSAEGKELEFLIRQVVEDGFSIQKEVKPQKITDWLKECITTNQDAASERSTERICEPS